ncbi:uncharacterized protein METZ01_LOCUS506770 [marine metagenome]|uniref:Uncharacterized protein n=1 Tax=marine metagenome TaxID=408172 RepID=A0A383EAP3_9ZZZZ
MEDYNIILLIINTYWYIFQESGDFTWRVVEEGS